MNREETQNAIKVMQASLDGKPLEVRSFGEKKWTKLELHPPSWNWHDSEYRIAPEPMEIEVWVAKDGSVAFPQYHHPDYDWRDRGFTKKIFREVL